MKPKIRVIMFDWGGTIVNTDRQSSAYAPCAEAVVAHLRDHGVTIPDTAADNLPCAFGGALENSDDVMHIEEVDSYAVLSNWAAANQVGLNSHLTDEAIQALWRPWVGCLDVMGAGRGTLAALRAAGFTLGLVSNCAAHPAACAAEADRQGIRSSLQFTLFSSELGVRKPHRRVYETAFDRAGAVMRGAGQSPLEPAEALFVGDTLNADIDGPGAFGMQTALVRTGRWRGDTSAFKRTPDLIVDSIDDLPRHLSQATAAHKGE